VFRPKKESVNGPMLLAGLVRACGLGAMGAAAGDFTGAIVRLLILCFREPRVFQASGELIDGVRSVEVFDGGGAKQWEGGNI